MRAHQWLAIDHAFILALLGARLGEIFLLTLVVPTLEGTLVQRAGLLQALNKFLHLAFMPWLGCADKIGVADLKKWKNSFKFCGICVGPRLGSDVVFGGGFFHLHAVLIRAREKKHVAILQAHGARPGVAQCGGEDVANMRAIIDIINWSGDAGRSSHVVQSN